MEFVLAPWNVLRHAATRDVPHSLWVCVFSFNLLKYLQTVFSCGEFFELVFLREELLWRISHVGFPDCKMRLKGITAKFHRILKTCGK